jgi:hypothetical protein
MALISTRMSVVFLVACEIVFKTVFFCRYVAGSSAVDNVDLAGVCPCGDTTDDFEFTDGKMSVFYYHITSFWRRRFTVSFASSVVTTRNLAALGTDWTCDQPHSPSNDQDWFLLFNDSGVLRAIVDCWFCRL